MTITKETFINFHKETMAAKKYHLSFLIMAPVFLLIGLLGGHIGLGVAMIIFMGIYILILRSKEKKILKKLEAGDYTLTKDVLTNKYAVRRNRKSNLYYIQSERKYVKAFNVLPQFFRAVEIGDEFVVVEVDHKFVMLYNLRENALDYELEMMVS